MPLPALALLLASQLPVTAWLRSITVLAVMTSAPSEPSDGMLSAALAAAMLIAATTAQVNRRIVVFIGLCFVCSCFVVVYRTEIACGPNHRRHRQSASGGQAGCRLRRILRLGEGALALLEAVGFWVAQSVSVVWPQHSATAWGGKRAPAAIPGRCRAGRKANGMKSKDIRAVCASVA